MPSASSSYLPPVPPAPTPDTQVDTLKPKKKSKILLVVLGIFALLGGLGLAGYYAYSNITGVVPLVAPVTENDKGQNTETEASCNGCDGGHKLVWRNNKCVWAARLCDEGNGDPTSGNERECTGCKGGFNVRWNGSTCIQVDRCNFDVIPEGSCTTNGGIWCDSIDSTGRAYAFCISASEQKGCNQAAVEHGYTITYGSSWRSAQDSTFKYKCTCGTTEYFFDKQGICSSAGPTTLNGTTTHPDYDMTKVLDAAYYDKWGLCGVVTNKPTPDGSTLDQLNSCFSCDNKGCRIISSAPACTQCTTIRYECDEQVTGRSCTKNPDPAATSSTSKGKCGTVEQIDVMCGGHYIQSRTILNGECNPADEIPNPSPSPSPGTPVLACTGLTQTPATASPALGSVLTFTCAGTVTPAGATALTYKFRYSLNDGADQLMTNVTANTARLTISTCGTYSVQCKVCGTIGGVQKCDPIWQGAVQ
jgi:hypothetical protein